MKAILLPIPEVKSFEIIDFSVDLLLSPPEIKEEIICGMDNSLSTCTDVMEIKYREAHADEGHLNIYVCKFKTGKHRLYIFGKIKGQEFRTEKELSETYSNSMGILNERIKYVLVSSRNILRTYYLSANMKSIENHLMAFLIPS
ncbi:MAG: hypothetical protein H7141_09480 [Burkholderiales bacterium]|nr:hypothetical protein [Bacteroidia bacterium]